MKLANSQQERDQKETAESKPESDGLSLSENERNEQLLVGNEEELKKEFERDCAKEWNRRRLARESIRLWRRRVRSGWNLSSGSIRVHGDVRGRV